MATVKFRMRRDTAANWTSVNPTLGLGEPGLETDTRKVKYGDGATAWTSLAYSAAGVVAWVDITSKPTTYAGYGLTAAALTKTDDTNVTMTLGGTPAAALIAATSLTLGWTGTLALARGGTAANTAAGARTNLGLGASDTVQHAALGLGISPVSGTILHLHSAGSGDVPLARFTNGTTGATATDGCLIGFNNTTQFTIYNYENDVMRFGTNNGLALVIDTSRNTRPASDNSLSSGTGSFRWSVVYAGTGTINTSDERTKDLAAPVPDEWLDAWGEVEWSRFKFLDAIAEKGDDARWHIGLVAQRVHAAFARHGVDAFQLGLLCFDSWAEETEDVCEEIDAAATAEVLELAPRPAQGPGCRSNRWRRVERPVMEQVLTKVGEDAGGNALYRMSQRQRVDRIRQPTGERCVTLAAGDRWGLRYEECFAIEAAYQRRRMDRLEAQLAALSA